MSQKMSGRKFKAVRELCGFSAAEVAEYLEQHGAPVKTARSIYRFEKMDEVPSRYVEALRSLVGEGAFNESLAEIQKLEEKKGGRTGKGESRVHRGRRERRTDGAPYVSKDDYLAFLNSLPVTSNTVHWIITFREALRRLLGDVDHISINVNVDCDLSNPEQYRTDIIATEHFEESIAPAGMFAVAIKSENDRPADRLLEDFRRNGYPVDRYRVPFSFDYYFGSQAYLGTIFLWRELGNQPIAQSTLDLVEQLRPFFTFALTDLVARHQDAKPFGRVFNDAFEFMSMSTRLTDQERRAVILLLFGHTYEQIADRLHVSIDTVKKHVKSVYRKTGTRSNTELFAKYFTPRLGF